MFFSIIFLTVVGLIPKYHFVSCTQKPGSSSTASLSLLLVGSLHIAIRNGGKAQINWIYRVPGMVGFGT